MKTLRIYKISFKKKFQMPHAMPYLETTVVWLILLKTHNILTPKFGKLFDIINCTDIDLIVWTLKVLGIFNWTFALASQQKIPLEILIIQIWKSLDSQIYTCCSFISYSWTLSTFFILHKIHKNITIYCGSYLLLSQLWPLYPVIQPRQVPSKMWQCLSWQFWGHIEEQDSPKTPVESQPDKRKKFQTNETKTQLNTELNTKYSVSRIGFFQTLRNECHL